MDKTFGIILMALVLLAMITLMKLLGRQENGDYDERQRQLRDQAFRRGFFAVLLFSVAHMLLSFSLGLHLMEEGVSSLLTAYVGILVFCVDAVWHGAFFRVRQKPWGYLAICAAVVLCNLIGSLGALKGGELLRGGMLTGEALPLVNAAMFTLLALTILLRLVWDKREDES